MTAVNQEIVLIRGHLRTLSPTQSNKDLIVTDCLEFLLLKAASGKRSEQSFDEDIAKVAASYRRLGRHDLALALPTSLREMMTYLRQSGVSR